jgi:hypothetical protein
MYYFLIGCIVYGIYLGFQEMNLVRTTNLDYQSPKNMVDFLLNEQTK